MDSILIADGVDEVYPDIVSRFRHMVSLHADRTALHYQDVRYSYRALAEDGERLAWALVARGVLPGDCLGVSGAIRPDMVVALLGILQAGAHYVYLNPDDPGSHLQRLTTRLGVKRLLSTAAPCTLAYALGLTGDTLTDLLQAPAECCDLPDLSASDLSYVNFSSGSCGEPKAIACTHGAVSRLCIGQPLLGLDADTRMLVNAPLSFDASTLEIWGALLNGGLCIFRETACLSSDELHCLIAAQGVNTLWLTAALFNTLVDLDPTCLRGARRVLVGGEVLSLAHVRRAMRANPAVCFINGYGPTENTTFTTCHRIVEADLAQPSIPIGTPIRGTGIAICDENLRPLPWGQVGELVTFGAGLAQGYVGNPGLEAQKFRQLELAGVRRRVYLSGDLACVNRAGVLEFHGRKDQEVKINGYRIDLAQLEQVLRSRPLVRDCVLVDVARQGGRVLLAGVVPQGPAQHALSALRADARLTLPAYQRPHAYCALASVPLTPNGKVDKARVIELWRASQVSGLDEAALPRSERYAASLWRRYTGHAPSGWDADFFASGGNSLLALRLLADVQHALPHAPALSMQAFYQASDFAAFCRWLKTLADEANWPGDAPPLAPAGVASAQFERFQSGDVVCVELNPYQRSMVLDELINGNLSGNTLFYQLRPDAPLGTARLTACARRLCARFPLLNSHIRLEGEQFVFVLDRATPEASLRLDPGDYEDERAFCLQYLHLAHSVFERGYFQLVAARVQGRPVWGVCVHHIVADAPFVEKLLRLLREDLSGSAAWSVPALDFDFALQNQRINQCLALERAPAEAYWRSLAPRFATGRAGLPMASQPRVALFEWDGAGAPRRALAQWALGRQLSPLALCSLLLARACRQAIGGAPDWLLATCSQRHPDLGADCAGCYVNLLPLSLVAARDDSAQALALMDQQVRAAMRFGSLPLEEILSACGARERGQVLINLLEEGEDYPHAWVRDLNALKVRRPLTLTVFLCRGGLARLRLAGYYACADLERILAAWLAQLDALLREGPAHDAHSLAVA